MGGTVLDMFTLDATPWSLALPPPTFPFFFSDCDTVVSSRFPSRFSPLSPFARSLPSFLFSFYFREFSQKRHANTRSASDQLCRAGEPARNFRVLIKHGALNGWCFRRREFGARHAPKRSMIVGRN